MRPTRIEYNGLHGRFSGAVDLTEPIAVLLGPNESGKSMLLGVQDLVLRGPTGSTWPVLGQSPDYDWEASVIFDAGVRVTRGRHGDPFVTIGGRPVGAREAPGRIAALLGEAPSFRVQDLLAMTPPKRLAWMEQRVLAGGGWDAARLQKELDASPGLVALMDALDVRPAGDVAREGLVRAIARASELHLEADRDAKAVAKAIEQADRERQQRALPPGTIVEWRSRIAALAEERARAREEQGRLRGAREAADGRTRRMADIEKTLPAKEADATRAREVERQSDENVKRRIVLAVQAREALASLATERASAQAAAESAWTTAGASERRLAAASLAIERAIAAKRDAEQLQQVVADVRLLVDHRTETPPIVRLREWCAAQERRATGQDEADARSAHKEAEQEHAASVELGRQAKAQVAAIEQREQAARTAVAQAEAEERAARTRAVLASKEAERAEAATLAAKMSLAELQASAVDAPVGNEEAIGEALAGIETAIADAQRAADQLTDAAGEAATRMDRLAQKEAAEKKRTRARGLRDGLRGVLSQLLRETVGPHEEVMSRITEGAMGCRAVVTMDGGFDLACRRGNVTVPWETCSESQQAILLLAFAVAAQGSLGGWRRLSVDGLECMDKDRRVAFVVALKGAVRRGDLDSAMLACVDDGWTAPDGVQIVRLERP